MILERNHKFGDFYTNSQGKLYQVITEAEYIETGENVIVYQELQGAYKVYIRSTAMFLNEMRKYEEGETVSDTVSSQSSIEEYDSDEDINPNLLVFLEADSYQEKLNVLETLRNHLDDMMIDDFCVSLDLTIDEGTLEEKYSELKNCLKMRARYESNRLR